MLRTSLFLSGISDLLGGAVAAATPGGATRPLDLERMFLGEEPPLFLVEVAIRTTVIFLYTLLLLRLLGKRGVAQLSLFEVTIIIGLGSAVGDPMFQKDVPLLHAMVVIGIIILLYRGFMALVRRNERFQRFVEGTPSCLVTNGRIDTAALDRERISPDELFDILRVQGITHLGEVKRAYLEQSGQVSVFAFPPKEVIAGLPIVPPWDIDDESKVLQADADLVDAGAYACRQCGKVTQRDVRRALSACDGCQGRQWAVATKDPLGSGVTGAAR